MAKKIKSAIDENFICHCGGEIKPIGEDKGLKVFRCSVCGRGPQTECPICHNPRMLWKEYGKICAICAGGKNNSYLKGIFEAIIGITIQKRVKRLIVEMYKNALKSPMSKN